MKGIFIAYDQAYNMEIVDAIEQLGCRGFTMWQDIAGRGGVGKRTGQAWKGVLTFNATISWEKQLFTSIHNNVEITMGQLWVQSSDPELSN